MKARTIWAVLLGLLAVSCGQNPIFYIVSTETAPRPPRIEGAPTNMVVFNNIMYVASGRLHWYAQSSATGMPEWDADEYWIPQPDGKISALAVAGNRLYASSWDNASLQYIEAGAAAWKSIFSGAIQTIFADPATKRLFAGVGNSSYDILYLADDDTLKTLKSGTSLLSGAVFKGGYYYLSTQGDGIYRVAEADLAIEKLNDDGAKELFMSMIKLPDNTIIAVERNKGTLYKVERDDVEDTDYAPMNYTIVDNATPIGTDKYAMCALALWEDPLDSGRRLLIASIQGALYSTTTSSYTYGYVEFVLNPNGSLDTREVRRDPGSLISVSDNDRYTTSLGKHPVNYLFQAPKNIDPHMTFFASTQTAGLWSYRDRPDNGGDQWNAEE